MDNKETREKKAPKGKDKRVAWGPCTLCVRRKARLVNGLCEPCDALTETEGTKKQLGIPTITRIRLRNEARLKEYRRLIKKGVLQAEIAQLWGEDPSAVRSWAGRMKVNGYDVPDALKVRRELIKKGKLPPINAPRRNRITEHGGGTLGVKDCTCELCVAVRKATKFRQNQRQIEKKRLRREERKKLNENLQSS